jgi:hypothetical protein
MSRRLLRIAVELSSKLAAAELATIGRRARLQYFQGF